MVQIGTAIWYSYRKFSQHQGTRDFMPNKDYYTASEAQQVLGLSKAEFHRRAGQGRIPRFLRTGYKQRPAVANCVNRG